MWLREGVYIEQQKPRLGKEPFGKWEVAFSLEVEEWSQGDVEPLNRSSHGAILSTRKEKKKETHKCHPYSDMLANVSVAAVLISPADMTMNITAQTKLVD